MCGVLGDRKVYKIAVRPTLLYGKETLSVKKTENLSKFSRTENVGMNIWDDKKERNELEINLSEALGGLLKLERRHMK